MIFVTDRSFLCVLRFHPQMDIILETDIQQLIGEYD